MGVFGRVNSAVTADPAGGVDITYTVEDNPIIQKIVIRANTPDSQPPVPAGTLLALMDTKPGQSAELPNPPARLGPPRRTPGRATCTSRALSRTAAATRSPLTVTPVS